MSLFISTTLKTKAMLEMITCYQKYSQNDTPIDIHWPMHFSYIFKATQLKITYSHLKSQIASFSLKAPRPIGQSAGRWNRAGSSPRWWSGRDPGSAEQPTAPFPTGWWPTPTGSGVPLGLPPRLPALAAGSPSLAWCQPAGTRQQSLMILKNKELLTFRPFNKSQTSSTTTILTPSSCTAFCFRISRSRPGVAITIFNKNRSIVLENIPDWYICITAFWENGFIARQKSWYNHNRCMNHQPKCYQPQCLSYGWHKHLFGKW